MKRYFTLKTAREALMTVRRTMAQLAELKSRLESCRGPVARLREQAWLTGGLHVDPEQAVSVFRRAIEAEEELREVLESLSGMGVIVRDLEAGIVDFPALSRGREVMLCWKTGEEDILWWHGADEGFQGRKPVDAEFEASLEC
ncbi:MAG: DUF2203 domain-containing protein [Bryobacteraceae bacterium]|jgi:hypothetical protein